MILNVVKLMFQARRIFLGEETNLTNNVLMKRYDNGQA
jgi:hypothetical protein